MPEPGDRPYRIVVAGVGGQGTLTVAQIVMEVARRAGRFVLQSELHGMSQRGGAVHACLTIATFPVTTPVVTEGTADLLLALEPVEALRYVALLRPEAPLLVAREPVKSVAAYPDEALLYATLDAVPGCELLDTTAASRTFRLKQAPSMLLLGRTARLLPFALTEWEQVIADRLAPKGAAAVERSLRAFRSGYAVDGMRPVAGTAERQAHG
jgi:indolepyruvate ferredoxin oxidoreductase beta subunit